MLRFKKYTVCIWSPTASQRQMNPKRTLRLVLVSSCLICVFIALTMAILYMSIYIHTPPNTVPLNWYTDIQYFSNSWEMLLLTHYGLSLFCRCYLKTLNYCDMPTKATEGTILALDRLYWNQLSPGAQMGSVSASFLFFSSTENQ